MSEAYVGVSFLEISVSKFGLRLPPLYNLNKYQEDMIHPGLIHDVLYL